MINRTSISITAVSLFIVISLQFSLSAQDASSSFSDIPDETYTAYDNWYIGGAGGFRNLSIDGVDGLSDTVNDVIDYNENDFSYKVYGGRRLHKHFGFELSVVDYGEPKGSVFDVSGVSDEFEVDEWGATLHAVGYIPHGITNPGHGESFEIFGKAGPAWVDGEGEIEATVLGTDVQASAEDEEFGGSFGVGANFYLSSNIALRAEGETILWLDEDADTERYMGYIGLQYHFR